MSLPPIMASPKATAPIRQPSVSLQILGTAPHLAPSGLEVVTSPMSRILALGYWGIQICMIVNWAFIKLFSDHPGWVAVCFLTEKPQSWDLNCRAFYPRRPLFPSLWRSAQLWQRWSLMRVVTGVISHSSATERNTICSSGLAWRTA